MIKRTKNGGLALTHTQKCDSALHVDVLEEAWVSSAWVMMMAMPSSELFELVMMAKPSSRVPE
jgi:hypothetical protein